MKQLWKAGYEHIVDNKMIIKTLEKKEQFFRKEYGDLHV